MMPDPDVSGWKPDFLPADEQLERQTDRLRTLVGVQVANAWVVWNLEHDEWFADLPVVVQMVDGEQLEICWEKFDDLSITWNTIDVSATPRAWVEWPLEWRDGPLDPLTAMVGASIKTVVASRFLFRTQNVVPSHDATAAWLTTGLWLGCDAGGLHIFNALDENGVDGAQPHRDEETDWRVI